MGLWGGGLRTLGRDADHNAMGPVQFSWSHGVAITSFFVKYALVRSVWYWLYVRDPKLVRITSTLLN